MTLLWHVLRRPAAQLTFAKTHCHPKRRSRMLDFLKAKACGKKIICISFPDVSISNKIYIYIYTYTYNEKNDCLFTSHVFIENLCIHGIFISYLSTYIYIYMDIYIYMCMLMYILIHFLISLFVHLSIHTYINMMY